MMLPTVFHSHIPGFIMTVKYIYFKVVNYVLSWIRVKLDLN